ncbi:MAG TPA: hypothetical protein VLE70_13255 [Anaerolineae bacterium]|nr:hypothetical protein [Anaerolineae bacterium]
MNVSKTKSGLFANRDHTLSPLLVGTAAGRRRDHWQPVTLYVSSTAEDGVFHAYLEDVAPAIRVPDPAGHRRA